MTNQKRTPAGVPTGGQFATNEHDEASSGLDDGTVTPPTCDRHGGEWGDDLTCETCTDEDGEPRPVPDNLDDVDYGPGKYDTTGDAKLFEQFAEGGLGGSGDVQSPTGWFADYSPGDGNHYLLREDEQGFSTVERFDTEEERDERYSELEDQYSEWADESYPDSIPMEVGETREAPRAGEPLSFDDADPYEAEDRVSHLIGEDDITASVKRVMPEDGSLSQTYDFEITGPGGTVTDRMYYPIGYSETPTLDSAVSGLAEAAWRLEMDAYEGEETEEDADAFRRDDEAAAAKLRALVGNDNYRSYVSGSGFEERFSE